MSDTSQLKNLLIGIAGIFTVYGMSSLLHEELIIGKFYNTLTEKEDNITGLVALVLFPSLLTWILGELYNLRLTQRVNIPNKNSTMCAGIIFTSAFTLNKAAAATSFPVSMGIKASNVLAILLVAVCCTRVREKSLKLPCSKIILGIIITIGVIIFSSFDPEIKNRSSKSEVLGVLFITISLFADGFLPDFQAQIKSEFKPQPTEMMTSINKFIAIISFVYMVITFELWQQLIFMVYHPKYTFVLFLFSLTGFAGQMFIYRLIKQFKQHILPFVITMRKIFTVFMNIIYYGHSTSWPQLMGMIIVTSAIIYQFSNEIKNQSSSTFEQIPDQQQNYPKLHMSQQIEIIELDKNIQHK